MLRVVKPGRDASEQIAYHRHHQRRWHTLAADIADAEEESVALNKIVKQVATHSLGGCQRSEQVDVFPFGEWWELVGNHRHLNLFGHVQFTLHHGLLGGRLFQILDILHKRVLHGGKGVAQVAYLIFILQPGQWGFEVPLSHLVGRLCQCHQRFCLLPDIPPADDPYQNLP